MINDVGITANRYDDKSTLNTNSDTLDGSVLQASSPSSSTSQINTPPNTSITKTVRFRRGRAAKACEVCHTRKVRCDMTENFPCTNCRAFNLTCTPREGRGKTRKIYASEFGSKCDVDEKCSSNDTKLSQAPHVNITNAYVYYPAGVPSAISAHESNFSQKFASRAYVRPSALFKSFREGVHFNSELPEDEVVSEILKTRTARVLHPGCEADLFGVKAHGAFLIPTAELSDHLIDIYFKYVHPIVPVVNRLEFMAAYKEDRDKPSLLLRQAMWCVSCRLSSHPGFIDDTGTTMRTSSVFYRRAKALFDVDFELNQEYQVCAAIILSLAVSNPLYINHNNFFWLRTAATLAQSMGLHRRLPNYTPLERQKQRRIWWTIYKRDISTSMAYGRPNMIRLEDCDIEMITAEDFIDSEGPIDDPNSKTALNIHYFIQSLRLNEIIALILRVQFTVKAEQLRSLHLLPDVTQCERALAEWVSQLPPQLNYSTKDSSRHDFMRALLYLEYYTVICVSHRPQVAHLFKMNNGWQNYPTWGIAFQAAHMVLQILQSLEKHKEIRMLPGWAVHSMFCAVLMLSLQRRVCQLDLHMSKTIDECLNTFCKLAEEVSKTHSTASWILQLAQDLKSEKLGIKLAKSMQRSHESQFSQRVSSNGSPHLNLRAPEICVYGSKNDNSASNNESNAIKPDFAATDLFPHDPHLAEVNDNINFSNLSSGDEKIPPDTMDMADWYDFLNYEGIDGIRSM